MLRRIVSALVVLGMLAQAGLFTAHNAMAVGAGETAPSWFCASDRPQANAARDRALDELAAALGEAPPEPSSSLPHCPDCAGFAAAALLPEAAAEFAPWPVAAPTALAESRAPATSSRPARPHSCGPPTL
jgi:hypothetical protein